MEGLTILGIIKGYLKRLPPETLDLVKDVLPTAVAAVDTIDLDKKQNEKEIIFILKVTNDNIELHTAAIAPKLIDNKQTLVITRTLGKPMMLIPESL